MASREHNLSGPNFPALELGSGVSPSTSSLGNLVVGSESSASRLCSHGRVKSAKAENLKESGPCFSGHVANIVDRDAAARLQGGSAGDQQEEGLGDVEDED